MKLARRFSDLRLGMRLGLVFGLVAAIVLAVVVAGVIRLDALNEQFARAVAERHAKTQLVHGIVEEFAVMSRAVSNALLADGKDEVGAELRRIEAGKQSVSRMLEQLGMADENDHSEEAKLLQAVHERNTGYLVGLIKFMRLLDAGRPADAKALLGAELKPRLEASSLAMRELSSLESRLMERSQRDAARVYRDARNLTFLLAALAIALSTLVAIWMARRVTAPLKEAVRVAARVAAGDLTARIEARSADETGQLMSALARMNQGLTGTVRHVRSSSDAIAGAVSELVVGNRDLLSRTEQQSASLEESAASIQQLTATVKQNAANANKASELARQAAEVANRGAEVMSHVIGTMDSIEGSAKRVEDIIGVIDSIAFQTNILALNAAVEAARAGEQGRGFAVVASEVRALAQRSGAAAKEIRGLIGDSASQVGKGAHFVDEAGSTMAGILASIKQVSGLVGEISAASHEQSSGIDQVSEAITEIEKATQQNAAMAEQSAAAMESLERQAQGLVAAVSVFKLDGADTPAAATVPELRRPALDLAATPAANALPV